MATHDEETKRFFKHSSVQVMLCPRMAGKKHSWVKKQEVGTIYTHHQKTVIVDADAGNGKRKIVSFVGGLDLCNGRYDNPTHPIFRTLETIHADDFHNPNFTARPSNDEIEAQNVESRRKRREEMERRRERKKKVNGINVISSSAEPAEVRIFDASEEAPGPGIVAEIIVMLIARDENTGVAVRELAVEDQQKLLFACVDVDSEKVSAEETESYEKLIAMIEAEEDEKKKRQ